MNVEQSVTLTLTEAECREYCTELGEAEGIISADPVDHGNTRTGLAVMRKLRDLLEQHGLGIRQQQQLEAGDRYRQWQASGLPPAPPPSLGYSHGPQPPFYVPAQPQPPSWAPAQPQPYPGTGGRA